MGMYQYPSNVTNLSAYMTIFRYQFAGDCFATDKLFDINNFSFKEGMALSDGIALPIPNGFLDNTSVSWMNSIGFDFMAGVGSKFIEMGSNVSSKATQDAMRVAGVVESKTSVISYEGTSIKDYICSWKCIPQSQAEAIALENIINIFENGMLTTKAGSIGGSTLPTTLSSLPGSSTMFSASPDIFQITVQGVNRIKILPCVVTSVTVNFDEGTFQVMGDGNLPIYNVSIIFKEIVARTKEIYSGLRNGIQF